MKPHRVRQICRSRNPFTPSIALWQHFVLPCHPLRQQRSLSTATETTPSSIPDAEAEAPPLTAPAPENTPQSPSDQQNTPRRAIRKIDGNPLRKVLDKKGEHAFASPKLASIHKNANARAEQHVGKTAQLLTKAKLAFDEAEDYEGVAVEAMAASRAVKENKLPWCVRSPPGEEKKAEERYG